MYDYHAHSNYSDGSFLSGMVSAAAEAGLDGVGFADHCTVSDRERVRDERAAYGFALDLTYERRRRAIEGLRAETDVTVYDAAEVDYHPADEPAICSFLAEAEFDYVLGSVHELDGANVQVAGNYAEKGDDALDAAVDRYFDSLVALVESELFDVAAHPDLIERTPPLRDRATAAHYERAARAFAESRTVPEVNAGRALREESVVHPAPDFFDALREYDVAVTVGTDAHEPDEVGTRADFLSEFVAGHDLEPVAPPGLDD